MRSFSLGVAVLTLASAVLMGCDMISPFESEKSDAAQSLDFHLSAPDTVAARDSFEVQFTIENQRDQDIHLTTGDSCLLELNTFSDGERVPFRGTEFGCYQVVTMHRVHANGTLGRTFELQAVTPEGKEPVSSGTHTVEAGFAASKGRGLNGETIRKVLQHELVVRQ